MDMQEGEWKDEGGVGNLHMLEHIPIFVFIQHNQKIQ